MITEWNSDNVRKSLGSKVVGHQVKQVEEEFGLERCGEGDMDYQLLKRVQEKYIS